jgi:hypothetical protein
LNRDSILRTYYHQNLLAVNKVVIPVAMTAQILSGMKFSIVNEHIIRTMKTIYLLRKNVESGPFSKADLETSGLYFSDLVWIEGESRTWMQVSEVPELKGIHLREEPRPVRKEKRQAQNPNDSDSNTGRVHPVLYYGSFRQEFETNLPHKSIYFPERIREEEDSTLFKKAPKKQTGVMTLPLVFLGLFSGAVLLKNIVDGRDNMTSVRATPSTNEAKNKNVKHEGPSLKPMAVSLNGK